MLRAALTVIGTLLVTSPAAACMGVPLEAAVSHSELIARTATIVLVDVIGARADQGDEFVIYTFRTREVLKGTAPATFTRRSGLGQHREDIVREDPVRDFDRHRDPWFWDGNGRTDARNDCSIVPTFVVGRRYLLFDTAPYHTKSFEEITHDDDRWLAAVRREARTSQPGFSQTVFEWLRARMPIELIEYNCPATHEIERAVRQVVWLAGAEVAPRPVEWPPGWRSAWEERCEHGGVFLRLHHPRYRTLDVIDRHVDFSSIEINVHFVGPKRVSLDEIQQKLR